MNNKPQGQRDVWLELRLSPEEYTAPDVTSAASPSGASSTSSGSGSAGAGYGLGLVVPDRFSRERIARIMRALCEREQQ